MKILIVGAGPTGLTAGIELIRLGAQVQIIDKRHQASTLSRAVGINPKSLHLLEASGISKQLLKNGIPLQTVYFHKGVNFLARVAIDSAFPIQYGYNYMLGLPQDKTEELMRERFIELGGEVSFGEELIGLEQDENSVTGRLKSGENITANYLIGADGVHSTVRECLQIKRKAKELPGFWSIADLVIEDLELVQAVSLYLLSQGKVIFVVPIGEKRYRFVSNTERVLDDLPFRPEIKKINREGKFKIQLSQVNSYQKGRVFLAGDAAHSHSPAGGRGMNLGIDDACELAKRLINGTHGDYTASRHKEGKRIIKGSETIRKLMTTKNPIKRFFVLWLFRAVNSCPWLQKKFALKLLYG